MRVRTRAIGFRAIGFHGYPVGQTASRANGNRIIPERYAVARELRQAGENIPDTHALYQEHCADSAHKTDPEAGTIARTQKIFPIPTTGVPGKIDLTDYILTNSYSSPARNTDPATQIRPSSDTRLRAATKASFGSRQTRPGFTM